MRCPRCGLINPSSAKRCDCGYDFQTQSVEQPYKAAPAEVAGSTGAGVAAGFFGGILGLALVLSLAKGRDTKRGAWIGFAAGLFLGVVGVLGRVIAAGSR
jgi:hypothetical protein